jgi:hypothetical protein
VLYPGGVHGFSNCIRRGMRLISQIIRRISAGRYGNLGKVGEEWLGWVPESVSTDSIVAMMEVIESASVWWKEHEILDSELLAMYN